MDQEFSPQTQYNLLYEGIDRVQNQILESQADELIIVCGATGGGKSTLIINQMGIPTRYVQEYGQIRVEVLDKDKYSVGIGNGPNSGTQMASIQVIKGRKFTDSTGFQDTKGVRQQVYNGFTNTCMFRKAKKIKIVMVIEHASIIAARGGAILKILQRLIKIVGTDFDIIKDSFIMVVSKTDEKTSNIQYLIMKLQGIANTNQTITNKSKQLLLTVTHNKRIVLFPKATFQKYDPKVLERELDKIQFAKLTKDGNISLSPDAYTMIQNLSTILANDLQQGAQAINQHLRQKFDKKVYADANSINQDCKKLKILHQMMQKWTKKILKIIDWYKFLDQLGHEMDLAPQLQKKLQKIITMIEFFKKLKGEQDIRTSFLPLLNQTVIQLLKNVQIQRSRLQSAQQKRISDQFHQQEMQRREDKYYNQLRMIQADHKLQIQKLREDNLRIQRQIADSNQKDRKQKEEQDIKNQQLITQLLNNQNQIKPKKQQKVQVRKVTDIYAYVRKKRRGRKGPRYVYEKVGQDIKVTYETKPIDE